MCNQPATAAAAAAVLSMTILSPFSSLDQSAYFIDYTKGTYITLDLHLSTLIRAVFIKLCTYTD